MKTFYGSCQHCSFCYSVNDRLPMFCPECGKGLFSKTELKMDLPLFDKLSSQFVIYSELKKA